MDMTMEQVIEFVEKHHCIPEKPLDIRPEERWLGPGYNIAAREWNKRHPDDPVELIDEAKREKFLANV